MLKFFRNKIHDKVNFFTEKSLDVFLDNVLKKRKNKKCEMKNDVNIFKTSKKYKYKNILKRKIKINFNKLNDAKKMGELIWVENYILENSEKIKKIIDVINNKCILEKYRTVKNKIIINEIAKTYVFLSLTKNNFDCIKHFRKIANMYKLFKKEIQILPFLMKYYFIFAFFNNTNELSYMRQKIVSMKNVKFLNSVKKLTDAQIYGLGLLNKNAELNNLKFNLNPLKAAYSVGVEFLRIHTENRAIMLWLEVL